MWSRVKKKLERNYSYSVILYENIQLYYEIQFTCYVRVCALIRHMHRLMGNVEGIFVGVFFSCRAVELAAWA